MTSLRDEFEKKLDDSNAAPMFLPLEFLKAITSDFATELELGRGGYGVVYKGVLRSGKIIAVKKLFEIHLLDDKTFQNEVCYLMEIKHQHIVQFIGYCAESSWETIKQPSGNFIWAEIPKRLLCFEYLCKKSLDKYISDESSVLEWNMRYEIIKGICSGLNFLHEECRIIHLDLKPKNILMDASMIPKIADFGLSRIFGTQQSRIVTENRVGSRGYMAPEYLIQGVVSMKADIFSLGVVIIEIITGHRDYPYFQLDDPHSTQQFIDKVLESWRNKFESTSKYILVEKYKVEIKQCIAIALKCVDPGMEKRPTTKDIIQLLNAVDQMEPNKELPSEMQCKDNSWVLHTTVSKELILHSISENMSNIRTDGTVRDVKKSQECLLPMPLLTSSTVSQNHQEATKESSKPRQAIDTTIEMEAHQELSLDLQCTDKLLVLKTTASKDLAPPSLTEGMLSNMTDGEVLDEAKLVEGLSPMLLSESSIDNHQDGPKASHESHSACDTSHTTTENEVIAGSSMILDVNPLELLFRFKSLKRSCCSLYLTNNTDKYVAFRLMEKNRNDHTCCISNLPMYSIVAPRATYTLVITTKIDQFLPKGNIDLILQNGIFGFSYLGGAVEYFHNTEALEDIVQVALKALYATRGETTFESIPPLIKVIWMEEGYSIENRYITSMDANQTQPLIITGHEYGWIRMWNYDTQKVIGWTQPSIATVSSIKFIARKQWFVAGSHDGYIHVYKYKNGMKKITSFKDHNGVVSSLAVHPTQPYVLSACHTQIKLWDWDQGWFGWKSIRTFKEHSDKVRAVAFNPEETNSFASASEDCTIKVWSLDSPKSRYTLFGHADKVECLDFFTCDGRLYLITGSQDCTAKIWDLQKKACVRTLKAQSSVTCVVYHPKLRDLLAGTEYGAVHFWSSTNFREIILDIRCYRSVHSLACLMGSRRVVIGFWNALSVIEICDEEEQVASMAINENSTSGAD